MHSIKLYIYICLDINNNYALVILWRPVNFIIQTKYSELLKFK